MMKYAGLGRSYGLQDVEPVERRRLSHLVDLGRDCGIEVGIDTT